MKAKVAVADTLVATLGVAASFSLVAKGGALMALIKGVTIGVALVWRMEAVTPVLQVARNISGDH